MLKLQTWVYNPEKGRDLATEVGQIDFDPSTVKTPEEAAKGFHKALSAYAATHGYDAKYVYLWEPQETARRGYGNCWMVSWEDGPFEWAVFLSLSATMHGPWGYTEPYHSFDLCFVQ